LSFIDKLSILVSADLREEIRVLRALHGIYLIDIIFILLIMAMSSSLFRLMVRSKQWLLSFEGSVI